MSRRHTQPTHCVCDIGSNLLPKHSDLPNEQRVCFYDESVKSHEFASGKENTLLTCDYCAKC